MQTLESIKSALGHRVPALFAEGPSPQVSDRYRFVRTTNYLEALLDRGWSLVEARQSGSSPYGLHRLVMEHSQAQVARADLGGIRPRLLVTNAHNGMRSLRANVGLFRIVCSNGLVVSAGPSASVTVRHVGDAAVQAQILTEQFFATLDQHYSQAEAWSQHQLTEDERLAYARAAWQARNGDEHVPSDYTLKRLVHPRRQADVGTDLWRTYNVVQERVTYGVRAIDRNLDLNIDLWQLAADLHARRN